jgi:hypothetical protein
MMEPFRRYQCADRKYSVLLEKRYGVKQLEGYCIDRLGWHR